MPAISPTLVPDLPQPIPPSTTSVGSTEDVAFFDRVRKHIANRSTFNEFLKLCNLFSQDLIDKNVLVHKASNFIGSNLELMTWFKNFVRYDGRDELIENRPAIGDAKVVLSNCRALGPSYRLLPKRERLRLCSGRDEMCLEVLNDEWASHPTWASEDSGFVAHRKNNFEESLHRIEEERHDYDFNIETCLRTIQLLEPVVQQLKLMSEEERGAFTLPVGLGGQSEAIYQRVIKKIYDRERGGRVIEDMFHRPAAVCPIVLARLKQKAEEWKASQVRSRLAFLWTCVLTSVVARMGKGVERANAQTVLEKSRPPRSKREDREQEAISTEGSSNRHSNKIRGAEAPANDILDEYIEVSIRVLL